MHYTGKRKKLNYEVV